MRNVIQHIIILLLSATAVLSCTAELAFNDSAMAPDDRYESDHANGYPIVITGTATDADTGKPIEDIRITATAKDDKGNELLTQKAYTGNDGKFTLRLSFEHSKTTIVAVADDQSGTYASSTHEMMVSGNSIYNIEEGVFYINGCDFHLRKVK